VGQRPAGYDPLEMMNITPSWVRRLGESGRACFDSLLCANLRSLQDSMNECMLCWETLLPNTVCHPAIKVDLKGILSYYQSRYAGAMYSGCGGGYLYVVSDRPVPGGFQVKVRLGEEE
jgi:hypothetical protein